MRSEDKAIEMRFADQKSLEMISIAFYTSSIRFTAKEWAASHRDVERKADR